MRKVLQKYIKPLAEFLEMRQREASLHLPQASF
jgi:hypothetical protein